MKTTAPICLLLLVLFLCSLFLNNSDASVDRLIRRRFIRQRGGKRGKTQAGRSYNNNNRPSGRDPRFFREIHSKYIDTLLWIHFSVQQLVARRAFQEHAEQSLVMQYRKRKEHLRYKMQNFSFIPLKKMLCFPVMLQQFSSHAPVVFQSCSSSFPVMRQQFSSYAPVVILRVEGPSFLSSIHNLPIFVAFISPLNLNLEPH